MKRSGPPKGVVEATSLQRSSSLAVRGSTNASGTPSAARRGSLRGAGGGDASATLTVDLRPSPDVGAFRCGSEKELSKELDEIQRALNERGDWNQRKTALKKLQAIVLGSVRHPGFVQQCARLREALIAQLQDLRSAIVRETCTVLFILAHALGNEFEPFALAVLPGLFRNTFVTIQVIAESSYLCARAVVRECVTSRVFGLLLKQLQSRNGSQRWRCAQILLMALQVYPTAFLERHVDALEATIGQCLDDARDDVRALGRTCFWAWSEVFEERSARFRARLDVSRQRLLNFERPEFPLRGSDIADQDRNEHPVEREFVVDAPSGASVNSAPSTTGVASHPSTPTSTYRGTYQGPALGVIDRPSSLRPPQVGRVKAGVRRAIRSPPQSSRGSPDRGTSSGTSPLVSPATSPTRIPTPGLSLNGISASFPQRKELPFQLAATLPDDKVHSVDETKDHGEANDRRGTRSPTYSIANDCQANMQHAECPVVAADRICDEKRFSSLSFPTSAIASAPILSPPQSPMPTSSGGAPGSDEELSRQAKPESTQKAASLALHSAKPESAQKAASVALHSVCHESIRPLGSHPGVSKMQPGNVADTASGNSITRRPLPISAMLADKSPTSRKETLRGLALAARSEDRAVWENYFGRVLIFVLENLNLRDLQGVRETALLCLQELVAGQPDFFHDFAEVVASRLFDTYRNCSQAERHTAAMVDRTLERLLGVIEPTRALKILETAIGSEASSLLQLVVRAIATTLQKMLPSDVLKELEMVLPGVVAALSNPEKDVREAAVFSLVDIYMHLGEQAMPLFMRDLTPSQMKLVTIYISRLQREKEEMLAVTS